MHIYLAGPYRAKNGHTVAENVQAASEVAAEVFEAGHVAVTPHLLTERAAKEADLTDEEWLDRTMSMLKRCDALLLLPRWQDSEGACDELDYAWKVGMPVYAASGAAGEAGAQKGIPEPHITEERCPEQCDAYIETVMRGYRTHLKKNADYSPANILGTGEVGIVTRVWDKVARLMELTGFRVQVAEPATFEGGREAQNEPIEDAWMDLHVYSIIAKLLRDGKWGK